MAKKKAASKAAGKKKTKAKTKSKSKAKTSSKVETALDTAADIALSEISEHASTSSAKVNLQGELTIYHAMANKQKLVDILAKSSGEPVPIDMSGVTEMDSAGFQLLLLAKREARNKGIDLSFVHCSAAVKEIIEAFFMTDHLKAS
ncbi:MAG: STAS domain-containing protein [Gammaproteobacteria bacterium]|nr:STAS domain-containing protein [Gammaproteobacteria bacterium]MDH5728429.1 STAS domain-containing protein [Gammaproteobacteria bacterium]